MATVLVVGATGILAPAASALAARGDEVTGVGRGQRVVPASVERVAVDSRDPGALASALGRGPWDAALVYAPAVTGRSLAEIAARVRGRLVLVRTSDAADPVRGDPPVPGDTLQLGWTESTPHRWHTPEEVSDAALEVLADGVPRTLGVVRPWSDRP